MRNERDNRMDGGDNRRPFMMRQNTAPVKVGDEVDVTIEAVGEKGDGVAKVKGFVLFVPNTQQGENCKVRVTRVLKKVGFAEKIGDASASSESAENSSEEEMGEDSEETESANEEEASPEAEDSEEF